MITVSKDETDTVMTSSSPAAMRRVWLFMAHFLLILCVSAGWTSVQAEAPVPAPPKSIVVLASFDQALPWTQSFIKGLTDERKRLNEQIDFFFEFIDQRRLGEKVPEQMQADYLKAKYSDRKIDAVIIESRYAQKFVENQGEYVFGSVPYVLMSSVKGNRSKLAVSTQVTNGDWLPGNAALLKYMHPDAKNIVIVSGSSGIAKSIVGKLMPAFGEAFPALTIQQLTNMPLDELKLALSQLPEGTVVLYTLYFRAPNGAQYTPRDVASWKIPLGDGTQIQQTVSIGLVENSAQYRDGDALLQQADRQLYRAKRSGKNRVCYEASTLPG